MPADGLESLFPIGEGSKHFHIGFDGKQGGERASQHALIFRQHYAYPLRHKASFDISLVARG